MAEVVGLYAYEGISFECPNCGCGLVFVDGGLYCYGCGALYGVIGFAG